MCVHVSVVIGEYFSGVMLELALYGVRRSQQIKEGHVTGKKPAIQSTKVRNRTRFVGNCRPFRVAGAHVQHEQWEEMELKRQVGGRSCRA